MMSEHGQHAWSVATQEAWVLGDRTRLEQVFDNLGPTTLDRAQGGLGLSTARGLVHWQGGTIGAHSQGLGSGSGFRVCLPLAEADVAAPAWQAAASATPARSAPPDCAHRTAPFPP